MRVGQHKSVDHGAISTLPRGRYISWTYFHSNVDLSISRLTS